MNEREILIEIIKGQKWAIENAEKELANLREPTYSIGDRFYVGDGKIKSILAQTGPNQVEMINLDNGNRWSKMVDVDAIYAITQKELEETTGFISVRYWDSLRKIYTGDPKDD